MDMNNNWIFFVNVPAATPMFMVFKDNGTPVKVLVVESPGEGMSKKHTSIRKLEVMNRMKYFKGTLVALGLSPDLCSNKLLG